MQLLDSAKLDLSAVAYAEDIRKGINDFLSVYADSLDKKFGHQHIADLQVGPITLTLFCMISICSNLYSFGIYTKN